MTTEQPNALRLAKWLDAMPSSGYALPNQAAAELRRLHEVNQELLAALKLALENICAAKLCEFNSMSSRHEMIRLMDAAIAVIHAAITKGEQA